MTDMRKLVDNMRANEDIARKLFDIETKVLACESSAQLFQTLINLLKNKFELGNVYLLFNQSVFHDVYNTHIAYQPTFLAGNEHIYSLPEEKLFRYLDNGNIRLTNQLHDVQGLLPANVLKPYYSFANIPLKRDQQLFACLIFADCSAKRFHEGLGAFHLEQLAMRVSLSISNVITREKLEFLASHDPLTGIKNRRSLETTIRSELSRYKRYATPFSLMFIDCNKFKTINDTYGHDCGDAVLQFIANSLSQLTRDSDDVFRFAGDEFVVTLSNQTLVQAHQIAKRFSDYFLQTSCQYKEHILYPTISCGVAQCTEGELSDSLLKRADIDLYEQKRK
jgi:diguanylate cyclase (GGDEF)-like protein